MGQQQETPLLKNPTFGRRDSNAGGQTTWQFPPTEGRPKNRRVFEERNQANGNYDLRLIKKQDAGATNGNTIRKEI
jgi:hypothetical protein